MGVIQSPSLIQSLIDHPWQPNAASRYRELMWRLFGGFPRHRWEDE